VFLRRRDNGQYLNSHGKWQTASVAALSVRDHIIIGSGLVGLARGTGSSGDVLFDNFTVAGANASSSARPLVQENFNNIPGGELPAGWSQWNSEWAFRIGGTPTKSGAHSLIATSASGVSARAWTNASTPANAQVSADVFLNSLASADVLVRGSNLSTASPSYYAVEVTRGLQVQLVKVAHGASTTLGTLQSNGYLSNQWVQITLRASGSSLLALVQRLDNHRYLASDGSWQSAPAAALSANDSTLTGAGQAGIGKEGDYDGTLHFDDFTVARPGPAPLAVAIRNISAGTVLSRPTTVEAQVSNASRLQKVEFYLDDELKATDSRSPYSWTLNPNQISNGAHIVTVVAYDAGGVTARASVNVNTHASTAGPTIPQHYSWIRIAELAYSGTPLGSFEKNLLKNSVDLVIPNTNLLPALDASVPNTPQLIYTNVSSLYDELLTDWLNYADEHDVSRESAFYHVTRPTPYSGLSSSSHQVNWFWAVYAGGSQPNFSDLTYAAHDPNSKSVAFGDTGTSIYLGYPDRFREINFNLALGAHDGWKGVLEYPTAVDAQGDPTAWASLKTITDTTYGLARSGQVTFDPPPGWVTASLNDSAPMYFVRIRTISDGTAPLANTILGRDYTNSHGTRSGTVPVFDYSADRNHDGYLNDQEYAHRHGGMNARFVYETRLFGIYGPMRPPTNPASAAFRNWAVDFDVRLLQGQPLADGLFVDNSSGKPPTDGSAVRESVGTYSTDYGAMLNAVGKAIAPRWIMANTSGGQTTADGVVSQNTGYFEEFALRPLSHNWQQFEDLADLIQHRAYLRSPTPYAILDSLASGGSPTDPRTQIATLAEYYMLADPTYTFLDFFGGQEPSTSWSRHWSPAVKYNVGQPLGTWSLFASGTDPANHGLTYHVYQRQYSNALVLYKPLSHSQGLTHDGTLGSNTSTVLRLNGAYRALRADGRLGSVITSISLRNGEGAILVKATGSD
jgi:hypothetical protein